MCLIPQIYRIQKFYRYFRNDKIGQRLSKGKKMTLKYI